MNNERFLNFWDHQADTFDQKIAPMERKYLAEDREWVCSRARGRVLEVAIGTGLNLPHYPPGLDLTGIEWSASMLAVARNRAARLGLPVELLVGDASSLPFEDASFDSVVITFSLCCIPDHRAALDEAARVLRPGGRLLIADHIAASVAPVRWAQRLLELVTVPSAGEHWTRRPLLELGARGFDVVESDRRVLGVLERVHATRK